MSHFGRFENDSIIKSLLKTIMENGRSLKMDDHAFKWTIIHLKCRIIRLKWTIIMKNGRSLGRKLDVHFLFSNPIP